MMEDERGKTVDVSPNYHPFSILHLPLPKLQTDY